MIHIKPIELTAESFKDYGQVIIRCSDQPSAENKEFTYWGRVSELKLSELASTGVLVPKKRESVVSKVERHATTPEIIAALEGESLLCVAKPSPDGTNEIEGIRVFHIYQGDTIAMHPGTWHWAPFPVNCETSRFLVIFASGTETNDLEIKALDEEVKIES